MLKLEIKSEELFSGILAGDMFKFNRGLVKVVNQEMK